MIFFFLFFHALLTVKIFLTEQTSLLKFDKIYQDRQNMPNCQKYPKRSTQFKIFSKLKVHEKKRKQKIKEKNAIYLDMYF